MVKIAGLFNMATMPINGWHLTPPPQVKNVGNEMRYTSYAIAPIHRMSWSQLIPLGR